MTKDRFYKDFTPEELEIGYSYMMAELEHLPESHFLRILFNIVWKDFQANKFKYDGATFVKERSKATIFELASFIHDWRNYLGYVGRIIDQEFIDIMIVLRYDFELIKERWLLLLIATPLNIFRHKYLLKKYQNPKSLNLYKLSNH